MSIKKEIKDIERGINKAERNIEKGINETEKGIERDVKNAEKWVHERRKFFIKLGFVVGLVALLLIISHFFLRTSGVGI
jgi:hypothetical protein